MSPQRTHRARRGLPRGYRRGSAGERGDGEGTHSPLATLNV
ncbi:hypothetical protein SSCG_00654 [Streptomyces clavuligerus]|nr:hypothetical protein SSCG_00654 [Streptomyces clavuligerus]